MALRDQPYLPLYIKDFLTDEKLILCSAHSTGVYIRLMCLMHKQEDYGKIKLHNKFNTFEEMLCKSMPYSKDDIRIALEELIDLDIIQKKSGFLHQKRMINDGILSMKKAEAGSKGGKLSHCNLNTYMDKQNSSKHSSKTEANTANANANANANETDTINTKDIYMSGCVLEVINDLNEVLGTNYKPTGNNKKLVMGRLKEGFTVENFKLVHRKMAKKWGIDEKMCTYLRPITLYSNKFESYLNMKEMSTKLTETGFKAYSVGQEWLRNKEAQENGGS